MRAKSILVNFVTYPGVGHAVDALQAAFGYQRANAGCEVHVVVNSRTAVELMTVSPWLSSTYTVEIPSAHAGVSEAVFRHIPRDWDYVVHDQNPSANAYGEYRTQAARYFRARIASGQVGNPTIPFEKHAPLRFSLPEESIGFARRLPSERLHVGLKPAGGSGDRSYYPSIESWMRIIEGLRERYSDVTVHLFGKLRAEGRHPETSAIAREDVDRLLERYAYCRDCFDVPLLDQLAVAQRCAVFIAPHTGFAFAVLAVGTPWLTISGGRNAEFFFAGVPFYSVMPDLRKYPAFDPATLQRTVVDPDGSERIVSMCARRIDDDLDEILAAASGLIERRWTFEQCMERWLRVWIKLHYPRLRRWAILYARPVKLRLLRTLQSRLGLLRRPAL